MNQLKASFLISILLIVTSMAPAQERVVEADKTVTTNHEVTVNGKKFPYKAVTGTQPIWNEDGKPIAAVHYTYYERSDVRDKASRPIVFSFNGGPGSGSVWMHLAYTGPRILNIDSEGYPLQPYGFKENPHSILDVADIVYVNPVNTGYSRILDKETKREEFFGLRADIKYLAEWINTFISRNNRWPSPKFLIGESYGTPRVSGLALELQNAHWMYLNGVILVSPTELGVNRGSQIEAANRLPYFAATAWHHNLLSEDLQSRDLDELLPEVEAYTIDELIPIMAKGGYITDEQRKSTAEKMAYYSGIEAKVFLQHNLDVPTSYFWKELLREEGFSVGRLDSRYLGIDRTDAGGRPDFNAELTSWLHSFTPAINHYFSTELNYKTDIKYNMFGPVRPWDWDRFNDGTGENLRQAMAQNPYLNVLFQSGYYDGATTYFEAKYTMWQLDPSGKMRDRIGFEGYRSGHMMYLRKEDLKASNDHVRNFIIKSLPDKNTPAQYKR